MQIREALNQGKLQLEASLKDQNLALDSSLLLAHVMGISREQLYARLAEDLTKEFLVQYLQLIEQRSQGYPLAYLTGIKEFYGRDFHVFPGLLCPRPDTEILVEEALKFLDERKGAQTPQVLDLCTGTGCIGLTLKAERPLDLLCSDLSGDSEKCFKMNRRSLDLEARFIRSDLFGSIEGTFDLIVTNPPYLTSVETHERMADNWKEPELALDGGGDGLDLIRIIIAQAPAFLKSGASLMIEADPAQMVKMKELMEENGFRSVDFIKDLADDDRVIKGVFYG